MRDREPPGIGAYLIPGAIIGGLLWVLVIRWVVKAVW